MYTHIYEFEGKTGRVNTVSYVFRTSELIINLKKKSGLDLNELDFSFPSNINTQPL